MRDIAIRQVLVIEDSSVEKSAVMSRAIDALCAELEKRNVKNRRALSYQEAWPVVENEMDFDAILLSTSMDEDKREAAGGRKLLKLIAVRQPGVPVFLLADHADSSEALDSALLRGSNEYVWIFEDSPFFISGRIEATVERFRAQLLPPLMKAIFEYNESCHEYSWAAPGHQGGRGFTKSPAGKKFYDFYDENLFRTDTGIERVSIGSLLDHTGAFGESEKRAAETFGADHSYSVVVGSSGSNRTILQSCICPGDIALCDRNCHKSIEQGLILSGAVPVYLIPTRNQYGIIGPVPPRELHRETIADKIARQKLPHSGNTRGYAVVTNCTYDGICYNARKVEEELDPSTDRLHFDEAWYGYARFNRMYHDHYAMRGDPRKRSRSGPTLFATHSTHKLLTALSQASYIHVRDGRKSISFDRMNQAYMLHATTSPLYAICASNDVAVKMMADSGETLTQEVIDEAVEFRQALARLERDFSKRKEWFFKVWNAPKVTDPEGGRVYDFADAPHELLARCQRCWWLNPGEAWHGFGELEENWAMLDPIKVSILSGEVSDKGEFLGSGAPAALVSNYIYYDGIVPTRTTDFQLMFLFSMGITKGKWVTLLNSLLRFKQLYDSNTPVSQALPQLAVAYPGVYGDMGLRDLGEKMLDYIARNTSTAKLNAAFDVMPEPAMTPHEAFLEIVRDNVELVPADKLPGRVTANSVIPYPPGIPMLMSGERFGDAGSPQIAYLRALSDWDASFPGFEHETEGSTVIDGVYHVMCVKQ